MPKTLKDLFLDKDYQVPFVEKPSKPENIVNSEINPTRPLLQFGKNLPKIYGTDLVRIESRGSIDPARTLAVNSSRLPDTKGGGFGRLLSNLLGQGGAYRPSDTIFENKNGAPITKGTQPVNGDWNALKYAVESDIDYTISQHPTNPSKLDNLLNGLAKGNNAKEMAQQAVGKAVGAAQDLVTKGINRALTSNRKKVKPELDNSKNVYDNNTISSEYVNIGRYYRKGMDKPQEAGLFKRSEKGITAFDNKRDEVINRNYYDDNQLKELVSKHTKSGITNLEFKVDGKIIVLPAALNGDVAETVNAQWNKFQYVGSPFKNYRFNDVERIIRISFKVYWLTNAQQMFARQKLSSLRALAFPSSNLQNIKIGTNKYAPLVFTPQIVKFSLGNYYRNMNVVVSNVSLGVPQQVSWASTNPEFTEETSIVYPTAVDVSMDMMIIETHIQNKDNTITYQMDEVIDEPDWVWEPGPEDPTPPPATIPNDKPKELPRRPKGKPKPKTPPKTEPEPYKLNIEIPRMIQDNTDAYRPKIRPDGSLYYGGRGSSSG
jgi:hypothetical protein